MNSRIYLSAPHMGGLEQKYINEAFESNWIAPLGPNVDAFEQELAEKVGSKGAAALSSGTSAIHLALKYIGVKKGDKVFCSSLTFSATCNPIVYEGGEPVFIDSDPDTWNMSVIALERAFSDAAKEGWMPKALIVVNLYGQSADMDPILELCRKHNIPVIEDAAESLGATYKGKNSGSLGDFGVYSFNGNKIITTSGGGMLISDNTQALDKVRFWATQSRDAARHYQHSEIGYNYRMSNILAGIGRGQLRVLDDRVKRRKEVNKTYKSELGSNEAIEFMPVASYGEPNFWLTAVTLKKGSNVTPYEIMDALAAENIESRPVWKPMHLQPVFTGCGYYMHKEDISADLFERGICLPSGSSLTEEEQCRVIDCIKRLF
ncbi:MAG: aminotransferase class I/II-fold pyridoxal phosphate-dependent enzyme [Clostridia bacterium]|nr:aminotransferase class I/II-fold pyridoxal phosphate-dependent enzyme [Clostridia bacterium]